MTLETAIVLCGGRGTRLRTDTEKPLVEVCGRPMVDRVCAALAASEIDRIVAAVSPHAPETAGYLRSGPAGDVELIETPGDGYVEDLGVVLDWVGTPVLTVSADLPLLTGSIVDSVLDSIDDPLLSTTVCVPVKTKRSLGVSVDTSFTPEGFDRAIAPSGLNVVAESGEAIVVRRDRALAVNVNRPCDLQIANVWCQR